MHSMGVKKMPKSTVFIGARGFSILELMIAIAVIGTLMALAQPSLIAIFNSNRLTGTANELLTTMQIARTEAVKRNARVVVCRSANADAAAPTCAPGAGNWSGWIAYVDDGGAAPGNVALNARNSALDANETILRVGSIPAPIVVVASPAISGASQRIIFRPDGMARAANALLFAQLRVCIATATPADNARDLAIATGSRMGVKKQNASGACAAPTDVES